MTWADSAKTLFLFIGTSPVSHSRAKARRFCRCRRGISTARPRSPDRGIRLGAHDKVNSPSLLEQRIAAWGLPSSALTSSLGEFSKAFALHVEPLVVCIPDFLTHEECDALMEMQHVDRENLDESKVESDLYLNYRVNQEAILPRVLRLLGMEGSRDAIFEEGQWVRPNRRTLVIRDQTTVHYLQGEGVAPHVDGKDATLLVYLTSAASEQAGGATTFPHINLKVPPFKGMALLYESRDNQLLHYAESVKEGEKWVMQLLIDFRYKPGEFEFDYRTGQLF